MAAKRLTTVEQLETAMRKVREQDLILQGAEEELDGRCTALEAQDLVLAAEDTRLKNRMDTMETLQQNRYEELTGRDAELESTDAALQTRCAALESRDTELAAEDARLGQQLTAEAEARQEQDEALAAADEALRETDAGLQEQLEILQEADRNLTEADTQLGGRIDEAGEELQKVRDELQEADRTLAEKDTALEERIDGIHIPELVSELTNDKGYLTQDEAAELIGGIDRLTYRLMGSLEDIDLTAADAGQYIYLVPKTDVQSDDRYDEYMVLSSELEKVGSWSLDLSEYVTDTELTDRLKEYATEEALRRQAQVFLSRAEFEEQIAGYVKTDPDRGLSANDFTDELLARLQGISEGATRTEKSQVNGNIVIDGVETPVYTPPPSSVRTAEITIPAAGWTDAEDQSDGYLKQCDAEAEGAAPEDWPCVTVAPESMAAARQCQLCPVAETLDGKIRFRAAVQPEGDLNATVLLAGTGVAA